MGGRSDVPTVETTLPLDKAAHFLFYGFLGILACVGWKRAGRWPPLLVPIALALLVGAVDEVHQSTVPGRSPDVYDWFADTAGILIASWVVLKMSKETVNAD